MLSIFPAARSLSLAVGYRGRSNFWLLAGFQYFGYTRNIRGKTAKQNQPHAFTLQWRFGIEFNVLILKLLT